MSYIHVHVYLYIDIADTLYIHVYVHVHIYTHLCTMTNESTVEDDLKKCFSIIYLFADDQLLILPTSTLTACMCIGDCKLTLTGSSEGQRALHLAVAAATRFEYITQQEVHI